MRTNELAIAPWANLDALAIDHRFPYAVGDRGLYWDCPIMRWDELRQ